MYYLIRGAIALWNVQHHFKAQKLAVVATSLASE